MTDLHQRTDLTLTGVLKHVDVMEEAGLVRTEKRGRTRYYHLQTEKLRTAEQWVHETRTFWTGAHNRLNQFLEENPE